MKNLTLLLSILFLPTAFATEISFTVDDPGLQATTNSSHLEVGKKILKTLKDHNLQVTLFVCGKRIDSPDGLKLLKLWNDHGHTLGNHTYSHENYNSNDFDSKFLGLDILKGEAVINKFSNFKKIFRYPMLKEGNTVKKRDEIRTFLKKNNYTFGPVSIDTSEWYISDRMVERLEKNPGAKLEGFRDFYLKHMWERATYYNELSKKVLGREVKHNILIHHNPLNAYFLNDLIEMFKMKGWKIINSSEAFKDPVYSQMPKSLPAGEGLIWALAKETGKFENVLRFPGEDGDYEKAEMDKLGL